MSKSALIRIALVVLGLLPILLWGYAAYGYVLSHQMAGEGARKVGQAAAILLIILLGLTPAFIGGILMIVGGWLLKRKPLGARIAATVGIVLTVATALIALAFEGASAHDSMFIAGAVYVLLHGGLIVGLWRRPAL